MNKITIAFFAAMTLASFAGCKKKGGGATVDQVAEATKWRDKACACKAGEAECAKKVTDEMMKWAEETKKKMGDQAAKAVTPDPKAEPINKEMADCLSKAMMPAGGTDPAAGSADPAAGSAADPAAGSGAAGSGAADPAAGSGAAGSAAADPAAGSAAPAEPKK